VTGLLKGSVELFSGNPHGLIVILLSGLAGIVVDMVWLAAGRRDRLVVYMVAGGLGAASNLLAFKFILSIPAYRSMNIALLVIAAVAFASGAVLAGALGWSLMRGLHRAGIVATYCPSRSGRDTGPAWLSIGVFGVLVAVIGTAVYFSLLRQARPADGKTPAATSAASSAATSPVQ
jgi:hypothetical protein